MADQAVKRMETTGLEIRRAVQAEREELEALQARASLADPGDRQAMLANPDAIEVPLQQLTLGKVFVAVVDGTIRGFAAIVPRDDGAAELDALFVEPGQWRKGIGRALVARIVEEARAMEAPSLHVIGNPHAEAFYAATGFERIGSQATRFGPALLLRRPL